MKRGYFYISDGVCVKFRHNTCKMLNKGDIKFSIDENRYSNGSFPIVTIIIFDIYMKSNVVSSPLEQD